MLGAPDSDFLAFQEALAGRYSLARELGRGGMGIVYLAREVRLDRLVALKLLPPSCAAKPDLKERFLREARAAAKLSHPNIVPIHAVDEAGGFVFFAMAYVEGETLGQRIRRRGAIPAGEATRILREVAWALAYAHAQGVVHRDVKPDNILIEAGSGRALVTDFGIAHLTDGPRLAGAADVLGTAEYMSPEQASGEPVDARSDLYSLGVVGYHMLSGQLPFQGASSAATLAKHVTQPAPPLSAVAPEAPRRIAEAVDRCLAKAPAERFTGGEELAAALTRIIEERRDLPVALRAFSDKNLESSGTFGALGLFAVMASGALVPLALTENLPPIGVLATIVLLNAGVASIPLVMLTHAARRLLGSGHEHDDLVLALRRDLEARREELGADRASGPSRVDRWLQGLTVGTLGVMVGGWIWLAFGQYHPLMETVFPLILGPATLVFLGGKFTEAVRRHLRGHLPGEPWLSFWESAAGRWIFKLARLGLDRLPAAGTPYRPTELAIGLAADRLFAELPKDLRRSFRELPGVVRALEQHAEKMRARVKKLDGMVGDAGEGLDGPRGAAAAARGVGGKRDVLVSDLRAARAAAEARLAEVVAALETIRMELLRMHAGAGSVESMTADLGSARELAEELERLVEGRLEVDALLRLPLPAELRETPTPA
ncbi:MAG: serine/threonine-protein kinase [Longimicrobiales bacterium]|nr:serine/threonine-protein kinase [Longimicrobiales bacterium]